MKFQWANFFKINLDPSKAKDMFFLQGSIPIMFSQVSCNNNEKPDQSVLG